MSVLSGNPILINQRTNKKNNKATYLYRGGGYRKMKSILDFIFWNSIYAAMIAVAVLALRIPLRRTPRIYSYMLWAVVFFRMICPLSLHSELSVVPDLSRDYQLYSQDSVASSEDDFEGSFDTEESASIIDGNTPANESLYPSENPGTIQDTHTRFLWSEINAVNLIFIVWISGFAVLAFLLLYSYLKLKSEIKTATRVNGNIYESDQIDTAFVLGIIKPKIYIPCWIKENNNTRYMISHERIHIQRLDYIIKPVACVITMLHWFNPMAWVAYVCMCRDMEMSCDESVINAYGERIKKEYGSMLLDFGVKRALAIETAFGEASTKVRIINSLRYKRPTRAAAIVATIAVLLTVTACVGSRSSNTPVVVNEPNEFTQAYEDSIKDFEFSIENGTATVDKYTGNKSSVDIPSSYLGYPVSKVGPSFMMDNSTATTVNIPDSVEVISEFAFQYCTGLEYINIPDSVKFIGSQCFEGCASLERVDMPEGLVKMGSLVFNQCASLQQINIPSSLVLLPSYTFGGCSSLVSVTLNNGLEEIGNSAFSYCTSLEKIIIPDGVWKIGNSAFENCTMISEIEIPDSVVLWGKDVFNGCVLLPDNIIPNVVVMCGEDYSSDIVEFDVPEGVYRVRRFALREKLQTVILPDSLVDIEACAFSSCYNLKDVHFGKGLKVIGYEAFSNCHSLEHVVLPEGVKMIEHWAFCDCPELKEITIPASVTFMGDAIFDACSDDLVIICKEGSVAHNYAIDYNIDFRFY